MKIKLLIFLTIMLLVGISSYYYLSSREPIGSLDDIMIRNLQEYIRIDTTHPNPNYQQALCLLESYACRDGFLFKKIMLPSGNPVGIISFLGTDSFKPSLVLNHHMDVVQATNVAEWVADPFAAQIIDGNLVGRGVQDMKGIGMVHYFALKALKDSGFVPSRTIHILAVPDEEVGGFKGTKEFVNSDIFESLNIGFVIDEGHASGLDDVLEIKVSERKPIQIIVHGKGALAHGSHLQNFNVAHELIQFLNFIVNLHVKSQIESRTTAPGKLLSLNISSLTAGVRKPDGTVAYNMIPDDAQASIDIRVPPTIKKKDVIELLDDAFKKYRHLTYKIMAQADEEPDFSEDETFLYKELKKTIQSFGYDVKPHYFEASSDLRFYLAKGIDSVGFTPFTIQDNIHGTDESVPVRQLIKAREIMTEFIRNFTA
ncbi:MAG TPA: M20/M25/M40 family metallo-hydrolase [Candidatus Dependentiae bacterium]|nr:M20/M25/M40 family metallo-hydrolase [Candidatus Dependentiae bacterium]HRQ62368.1 M20/M25/M40 family metallo-hydrolase [Candidatus Dependentiae bacterium]